MQSSARPGPAAIIPLSDLLSSHAGCKIRTAGFAIAYDAPSQLGLITHRRVTLLVDYGLIAPTSFELKAKVMVMGDVCMSDGPLPTSLQPPIPKVPARLQSPPLPGIMLRATVLRPCPDLDFDLWEEAARTESAVRWQEVKERRGNA